MEVIAVAQTVDGPVAPLGLRPDRAGVSFAANSADQQPASDLATGHGSAEDRLKRLDAFTARAGTPAEAWNATRPPN